MRNFLFILVSIVAIFTSCTNEVIEESLTTNVVFTPTLEETYSPITRATSDFTISNIYVYEIVDNIPNILLHKTDMSPISLNLTYGTHELRFIATNSEDAVLTGDILSWSRIKDTYVASTTIDVVAGLGNQNITLNRNAAKLTIAATDALPENTATAEIAFMKHNSLNVCTLNVTELANNSTSFIFKSSQYSATDIILNIWSLTDVEESYTTDVTLKFLDTSSNIISYFTIPNVTIKHNTNTILTGSVFNRNTGMALDFNQDWKEAINLTF